MQGASNRALAERLRRLVLLSGLSERALSLRCGHNGTHLGLLIDRLCSNEHSDVQRRTLESIATTCEVSLDWLVLGVGVEPTSEHVRSAIDATRRGL